MCFHSIRKIGLLSVFLLFSSIVLVDAHPHMMVYPELTFIVEDETCTSIKMDWEFDTMFSMSIIDSFDVNKNKRFETKEIDNIYDHAFLNLKNYHFFLNIQKGNKIFYPDIISDFTASQKDGKLSYQFNVSLRPFHLDEDFTLSIFDPTLFCAISYRNDPVGFSKTTIGKVPAFTLSTNKNEPFYYDPQGAVDDTTVYESWKPGLKTAYPEVIYVDL